MDELTSLIHLTCADLTPHQNKKLLQAFGTASELLGAGSSGWAEIALPAAACRQLRRDFSAQIDATLKWAEQQHNQILTLEDAEYPDLLKQIHDPPPLLYLQGDISALSQPQIAIVGARKASPSAVKIANRFAAALTTSGLSVTSGLAGGIDSAAHAGALEAATMPSIAVLGNGPDIIYPKKNRSLQQQLQAVGLVVSEFPPGSPPLARHFPRRNRIISGLSLGTLVIEAALKSGSLITARLALEQNRQVYAIPGSILNPLARGCHALIQQGAKLVQTPQDILEDVVIEWPALPLADSCNILNYRGKNTTKQAVTAITSTTPPTGRSATSQQQLLDALGYDPVSIDTLTVTCGLAPQAILAGLLELELAGLVTAIPGGRYVRC